MQAWWWWPGIIAGPRPPRLLLAIPIVSRLPCLPLPKPVYPKQTRQLVRLPPVIDNVFETTRFRMIILAQVALESIPTPPATATRRRPPPGSPTLVPRPPTQEKHPLPFCHLRDSLSLTDDAYLPREGVPQGSGALYVCQSGKQLKSAPADHSCTHLCAKQRAGRARDQHSLACDDNGDVLPLLRRPRAMGERLSLERKPNDAGEE